MKFKKEIGIDETITIGELYKRHYGESGSPFAMELFYNIHVRDNEKLIVKSDVWPITVKRKKTFFQKTLDKLK